jgi:hypothetical protein
MLTVREASQGRQIWTRYAKPCNKQRQGRRLVEDELTAILEKLRGGIVRSVGGHEASGIGASAGDSETEPAGKRYGPKRVKRKAATSIRKKKKMSGAV